MLQKSLIYLQRIVATIYIALFALVSYADWGYIFYQMKMFISEPAMFVFVIAAALLLKKKKYRFLCLLFSMLAFSFILDEITILAADGGYYVSELSENRFESAIVRAFFSIPWVYLLYAAAYTVPFIKGERELSEIRDQIVLLPEKTVSLIKEWRDTMVKIAAWVQKNMTNILLLIIVILLIVLIVVMSQKESMYY